MQSRYVPLQAIRNELTALQQTVSWLFDKLSNNNASDDGLSLSVSVAVTKEILEVILMPGNDTILMAYQINTCYNTYASDEASAVLIMACVL